MVILKNIRIKKEYLKALSDTMLLLALSLMPTFFALVLKIFGIINKPLSNLYDEGELFLYSISFLGSAFIIYKQLNNSLFKTYGNLIIGFLFIISCFYTAASLYSEHKNINLILTISLIAMLISIPFLYHSQVLSNREQAPDIRDYREDDQKIIENALK